MRALVAHLNYGSHLEIEKVGDREFSATLTVLHDDALGVYTRTFTVERDPERYNPWALVMVALQAMGVEAFQHEGWEPNARGLDG